jgi:hypothetical protein
MRALMTLGTVLVLILTQRAFGLDETASSQQEFDALVKAQRDAQSAFNKAYQAAKTREEKDQVLKEHRDSSPQYHSQGFAKLVEKYPNDPVAMKALEWLFQRDPASAATTAAINALGDDVIQQGLRTNRWS